MTAPHALAAPPNPTTGHTTTRKPGGSAPRHGWWRRGSAGLVVAVVVAVGALTGCGGGGNTSCGINGCTVTFPRSGTAEVSVLGVTARLLRVDADIAQVEVAGQTVMVPVGGQTEAGGLIVRVEEITDAQVVIRISTV